MVEQENGCSKLNEIKLKDMKKLNGVVETHYGNGQLQSRANYKDDTLDCLCEAWHDNGQPWKRENYKDGELDRFIDWWHDGQLKNQ